VVEDLGLWRLPAFPPSRAVEEKDLGLAQLLQKVKHLQEANRRLRAQNEVLAAEVATLQQYQGIPASDTSCVAEVEPEPFGVSPTGVAVCLWSDWHWGERVADGSYSPQEARKRVVRLLTPA